MLVSTLFETRNVLVQSQDGVAKIEAEVIINPANPIFKGHFPETPIVPGVCMVQLVKEVVEQHLEKKLFLVSAGNIKFLTLLNPENQALVDVFVQVRSVSELVQVEGKLFFGETVYFKMKAEFIEDSIKS